MELNVMKNTVAQHKIENCIDASILRWMQEYDVFVAGGAVNSVFSNREVNDVDLYFPSVDSFHKFMNTIIDEELVKFSFVSKKSITMIQKSERVRDFKLQAVICGWYNTVESVFDSFDFTCCMGAWMPNKEEFVLHPRFMMDIAARGLHVNTNTKFPFQTVKRILKYMGYGYNINRLELYKLLFSIAMNTKVENWNNVRDILDGYYSEESDNEAITIGFPSGNCTLDSVIDFMDKASEDVRTMSQKSWCEDIKIKDMHKIVNGITR